MIKNKNWIKYNIGLLIAISLVTSINPISANYYLDPNGDLWSFPEQKFGDFDRNIDVISVVNYGSQLNIYFDGSIDQALEKYSIMILVLFNTDSDVSTYDAALIIETQSITQVDTYWADSIKLTVIGTHFGYNPNDEDVRMDIESSSIQYLFDTEKSDHLASADIFTLMIAQNKGENRQIFYDWAPNHMEFSTDFNIFDSVVNLPLVPLKSLEKDKTTDETETSDKETETTKIQDDGTNDRDNAVPNPLNYPTIILTLSVITLSVMIRKLKH
jgi:hypothetical protein